MFESINYSFFSLVNATPETSQFMINFAIFCAEYTFYLVVLFFALYWILGKGEQKRIVLSCVVMVLIAGTFAQIIGHIVASPRPFMIGVEHTFLAHAPNYSFPSDHMTFFSTIAMTFLFARNYMIGLGLFILSWFVAWARVFLGVHFPFDMIGAFFLALFVVGVFYPIWRVKGEVLSVKVIHLYEYVVDYLFKRK